MKDDDIIVDISFISGVCMGVLLMLIVGFFTDGLPNQVTRKIQQEAVGNGVAEWRVTTNGVSYFEWKVVEK